MVAVGNDGPVPPEARELLLLLDDRVAEAGHDVAAEGKGVVAADEVEL